MNPTADADKGPDTRQSGGLDRESDMSKRDHKSSGQDWRSNPSHNTRRDYPACRAIKVTTVLKWAAFAVVILVLASELVR